jgi:hypothetical protein
MANAVSTQKLHTASERPEPLVWVRSRTPTPSQHSFLASSEGKEGEGVVTRRLACLFDGGLGERETDAVREFMLLSFRAYYHNLGSSHSPLRYSARGDR